MNKTPASQKYITVKCPTLVCRKLLKVSALERNKKLRCMYCKKIFTIPDVQRKYFGKTSEKE